MMAERRSPPPQWKRMMESLGTENKDLNKELTVKKKYISKLEAKLTTGGYVERFAKLEEKTNRLQKKYQQLEDKCDGQAKTIEEQHREIAALNFALDQKVDEWNRLGHGETLQASLLLELGTSKERVALVERQLCQEVAAREKCTQALAEAAYEKKALQASYDQSALEVEQLRKRVNGMAQELQTVEDTKLQLLETLEDRVLEAQRVAGELDAMTKEQAEVRARMGEALQQKGALEEEVRAWETKHRQLNILKEIQEDKLLKETTKNTELTEKVTYTELQTQAMAQEHNDIVSKVDILQAQLMRTKDDRAQLVEEKCRIDEQLAVANLSNQHLSDKLQQHERDLHGLTCQAAEKELQVKSLQESLTALEEALQRVQCTAAEEQARLQQQVDAYAQQCAAAEQAQAALQQQVATLHQQLGSIQGKESTLHKAVTDKLGSVRAEAERLQQQNADLRHALDQRNEELGRLQRHLEAQAAAHFQRGTTGSRSRSQSAAMTELGWPEDIEDGDPAGLEQDPTAPVRGARGDLASQVAELTECNAQLQEQNEALRASKRDFVQKVKNKANAKLKDRVRQYEERFQCRSAQLLEAVTRLQEQNQGLTGKLSLLEAQTAALEYCASDAAHGHGAAVGALFGAPSPDDREGLYRPHMRPSPSHDAAAPMPPSSWPAFEAEARMSQPVPGSPTLDHQPESLAAGGVYTPSNLSSRTSPSQTNRPSPSQAGRMSPGPPPSGAGNPFSAATLPAAAGAAAPMLEWTARAEEKGAAPRGTGGQSGSEMPAPGSWRGPPQSTQNLKIPQSSEAPPATNSVQSDQQQPYAPVSPAGPSTRPSAPLQSPSILSSPPAQTVSPIGHAALQSLRSPPLHTGTALGSHDILTLMELAEADSAILATP
uniref:Uncharacterized protein n=1 Tax=Eutreptiella gymnastica TaxID=73025 RepID=A0A7S4GLA5_9EUGL